MRLNQVTVGATDVAASVDFYRRIGLQLIVDALPRYARLETPSGETFSIHQADRVSCTTIVYFEVEDVDRALAQTGLLPLEPPADRPWLWREARLADPSGNIICLYHAGENRRFPPWRIEPTGT